MMSIKLTVLGCGTSTGVPIPTCNCAVCTSEEPRNNRLRASVLLEVAGKSILIDASTDLRQQALREKILRIDAVLLTHPHADHVGGIDELRTWNFAQKSRIPLYGNAWTCSELRTRFPYIFTPAGGPRSGGGIPLLDLHEFDADDDRLTVAGIEVRPIALEHGTKQCVGYRIGPVAYVTDTQRIPPASLERLKSLKLLVLDCLRLAPHDTHLNLTAALDVVRALRPERTLLTHMGHDIDYFDGDKLLPKGVEFAYDGAILRID